MFVINIHVAVNMNFCFIILDIINHFLRNPGKGGNPDNENNSIEIIMLWCLFILSFWNISLIICFLVFVCVKIISINLVLMVYIIMCIREACILDKVYMCILINIIPILFILLYASNRFIFFWFIAPMAPIVVESMPQISIVLSCVSNVISVLSMAILGTSIIRGKFLVVVPSYTSVIHIWKGAVPSLNISTLRIKLLFIIRVFSILILLFSLWLVKIIPIIMIVDDILLKIRYLVLASFLCAFLLFILIISKVIMVNNSIVIYRIIQFLNVVSIMDVISILLSVVMLIIFVVCIILYKNIPSK